MNDIHKLIQVFDDKAFLYDKYRPRYPQKLHLDIIQLADLKPDASILEIGCGTGQITLDFLQHNYSFTALEKGKSLAAIASQNMAAYPKGQLIQTAFEDWVPTQKFDLLISAQAFHWIEKESGLKKILSLLKDNGAIALIWNLDISQHTAFWEQTSKVYDKYLPSHQGYKNLEERIPEYEQYIQAMNQIKNYTKIEYPWTKIYSPEEYLGLIQTFSSHGSLPESFFEEIQTIIAKNGNQVTRFYKTLLLFAQKA